MGANYIDLQLDGKLTQAQVKEKFDQVCREERDEYGRDPYSGSWGTKLGNGLRFETKVFPTTNAAAEYCQEHTDKWEHSLCVRAKNTKTETVKHFTYPPGVYSNQWSPWVSDYKKGLVTANELSPAEREKAKQVHTAFRAAETTFSKTKFEFDNLIKRLTDYSVPSLTVEYVRVLKAARKDFFKATKEYNRAKEAWTKLEEQLKKKYYKTKEVDLGELWYIGAWAPS